MKKSFVVSLFAISIIALSGILEAGGLPNTTRTLTTGIGSGTASSNVPGSHPYSTKSSASRSRNSSADISLTNFRGGYTNRTSNSFGKPASFPGRGTDHMNPVAGSKTEGKIPGFSNFPPSGGSHTGSGSTASVGAGIPSTVSTGAPSSASTGIPSSVSTGIPSSVSTGAPSTVTTGSAPASVPPALPSGATAGMEKARGQMSTHAPGGAPDAAFSGLEKRPTGAGRP